MDGPWDSSSQHILVFSQGSGRHIMSLEDSVPAVVFDVADRDWRSIQRLNWTAVGGSRQASWKNAENRFLKILKIGAITFATFDRTLTGTLVGLNSLLCCENELAVGIH